MTAQKHFLARPIYAVGPFTSGLVDLPPAYFSKQSRGSRGSPGLMVLPPAYFPNQFRSLPVFHTYKSSVPSLPTCLPDLPTRENLPGVSPGLCQGMGPAGHLFCLTGWPRWSCISGAYARTLSSLPGYRAFQTIICEPELYET